MKLTGIIFALKNSIIAKVKSMGVGTITYQGSGSGTSGGGSILAYRSVSSAPINLTQDDYLINCKSGSFVAQLPTAQSVTEGTVFVIKNSGLGTIALTPSGIQTIDGGGAAVSLYPYTSMMIMSDGVSNWVRVADFTTPT
jgi:hypothetical protein